MRGFVNVIMKGCVISGFQDYFFSKSINIIQLLKLLDILELSILMISFRLLSSVSPLKLDGPTLFLGRQMNSHAELWFSSSKLHNSNCLLAQFL